MIIRKAGSQDATFIATLLLQAMEDLVYKLIGERDSDKANAFLVQFTGTENNQYSWQNCFVAEEDGEIIGAINVYDGAKFHELRKPVIDSAKTHFNSDFIPEDETRKGEIYIDSLGVDPAHRGKGTGTKLLEHLINIYIIQQQQTIGLIVDEDNPAAKKLYLELGFETVGKQTLAGKKMEHLQIKPQNN